MVPKNIEENLSDFGVFTKVEMCYTLTPLMSPSIISHCRYIPRIRASLLDSEVAGERERATRGVNMGNRVYN